MEDLLVLELVHLFLFGAFYNVLALYRAFAFQKDLTLPFVLIMLVIVQPLCVVLGFVCAFEVYGMWYGILATDVLMLLYLDLEYFSIDWENEAEEIYLELEGRRLSD